VLEQAQPPAGDNPIDATPAPPAAADPDRGKRRRWLLIGAGIVLVLVAMTVASRCSGGDVRYTGAGDVCEGVAADPLASISLREVERATDAPIMAELPWTACRIAIDRAADLAELTVGVCVRDGKGAAIDALAHVRDAFEESASGVISRDVTGLGDEAFFSTGALYMVSDGSLSLGSAGSDSLVIARHGNLVVLVLLRGYPGSEQVQAVLADLARQAMARSPH
jgi:hypothetical protein